MTGVAVNVTLVPAQIAPEGLAIILTLAGKFGFTVIIIALLEAGEPVKHGLAFEVITTVTESLFAKVVVVKVAAVCPDTFTPFTCHW